MKKPSEISFRRCALALCIALATGCGGGGSEDSTPQPQQGAALEQTQTETPATAEPGDNVEQAVEVVSVESTTELEVPVTFDWSNKSPVALTLQLNDLSNNPAAGIGVEIYRPIDVALNEDLREPTAEEMDGISPLLQIVSSSDGTVSTTVDIPGHVVDSGYLYVVTRLVGVISKMYVPIEKTDQGYSASWSFGPIDISDLPLTEPEPPAEDLSQIRTPNGNAASGDYFLGSYRARFDYNYGYPWGMIGSPACDFETTQSRGLCKSTVSADDLKRIGLAVPEGSGPSAQLLNADASASNLIFSKPAKVAVTFLHEGAGYRNTVGFFQYDPNNPPTSHAEVDTAKVLFPNTSYYGSGGWLFSGDTIFIGEVDPAVDDAGMGFWLAANGFASGRGRGTDGHHFYTLKDLNPESTAANRKHAILMAEEVDPAKNTRRLWVAFEDIRLDYHYSDRDYNDLVIQIDVSPADALVNAASIPILSDHGIAIDADQDGVSDASDIDDTDPDRAFEVYYPGENDWGTLLAEDNWPLQGDYDMNDLVVRYRIREVLNSTGQIKDVEMTYRLDARGAAFHNGFAVALGDRVYSDNIEKSQLNGEDTLPITDPVYLAYEVFEDAWVHTWQGTSNTCWSFNTQLECDQQQATEFQLDLSFANPVARASLGSAPYNPYVFAYKVDNDVAGYTRLNANEIYSEGGEVNDIEIHLPHHLPTNGQSTDLFGSGDDASDAVQTYYVTGNNLPWMIDVPYMINYPSERTDISKAFPSFTQWVQSGGSLSKNWYLTSGTEEGLTYIEE